MVRTLKTGYHMMRLILKSQLLPGSIVTFSCHSMCTSTSITGRHVQCKFHKYSSNIYHYKMNTNIVVYAFSMQLVLTATTEGLNSVCFGSEFKIKNLNRPLSLYLYCLHCVILYTMYIQSLCHEKTCFFAYAKKKAQIS